MARGVSGVGIAVVTTGGILMYAGFRNVTPLAALKAVTSGKLTPLAVTTALDSATADVVHDQSKARSGGTAASKSSLVAFGKSLQASGYKVGEHPLFGGVAPVHTPNSRHYSGNAIDVNHGAGTSTGEQAMLAKLLDPAKAAGFDTIFMGKMRFANGTTINESGHYGHIHIQVPK